MHGIITRITTKKPLAFIFMIHQDSPNPFLIFVTLHAWHGMASHPNPPIPSNHNSSSLFPLFTWVLPMIATRPSTTLLSFSTFNPCTTYPSPFMKTNKQTNRTYSFFLCRGACMVYKHP